MNQTGTHLKITVPTIYTDTIIKNKSTPVVKKKNSQKVEAKAIIVNH